MERARCSGKTSSGVRHAIGIGGGWVEEMQPDGRSRTGRRTLRWGVPLLHCHSETVTAPRLAAEAAFSRLPANGRVASDADTFEFGSALRGNARDITGSAARLRRLRSFPLAGLAAPPVVAPRPLVVPARCALVGSAPLPLDRPPALQARTLPRRRLLCAATACFGCFPHRTT